MNAAPARLDMVRIRRWLNDAATGPRGPMYGDPLEWQLLVKHGLVQLAGNELRNVPIRRGAVWPVVVEMFVPTERAAVYVGCAGDDRRWNIVKAHLADLLTGEIQP